MNVKVLFLIVLIVTALLVTACGAKKEIPPQEPQKAAEATQKASEMPDELKSTVISKELKQQKNNTGKADLTKEEKIHELEGMNRQVDNVVGRSERNIEKFNETVGNESNRKLEQLKQVANTAKSFSRSITLLWWFTADEVKAFQVQHELLLSSLDARTRAYESLVQALSSNNSANASKAMAAIQDAHGKSAQAANGMRAVLKDIEKRVKEGK